MMRPMRKLQSLSVAKVVQLCLLLCLAIFCFIALRSFFGDKADLNDGLHQRILKEDYAEADNTLHDAVNNPLKDQPGPKAVSENSRNIVPIRGDISGDDDDYPGFVQPDQDNGEPSSHTAGTISKRKNVRRKFVPAVRNEPFEPPLPEGKTISPAIQQFLAKLPPSMMAGVRPANIAQPHIAQLAEKPLPFAQAQWQQQQRNNQAQPLDIIPEHNGATGTAQVPNWAVGNNGPNVMLPQQQEAMMTWQNTQQSGVPAATLTPPVVIKEKLVHFDLKGAPPLVKYYKLIFPLIKKMGATGLLMEYEDMFPYEGRLKISRASNAYTKEDIVTIRKLAKENGLYIIPLVQTFGHLEFVLKHKEFKEVREVSNFPQAVCPSRNSSFELVKELIAQIMAAHPDSNYLHIGADEVYQLGWCPVCGKVLAADQINGKQTLFLSYVAQLLTHIRQTYGQVRPIMWDDMFHTMSSQQIINGLGDLTKFVEPMIWSYYADWGHHLPSNGDLYANVFDNFWGATAFKGSAGESLQMPNIATQVRIHTSWLEALSYNGHKMKNFRGIALTGWSRFDHFYPLCELFPAAVPTLAINMQVLIDGGLSMAGIQKAANALLCQQVPVNLEFVNYDPYLEGFSTCTFPGVEVFQSIHGIAGLTKMITEHIDELEKKFPEYQSRQGFVQPARAEEILLKLDNNKMILEQYMRMANSTFATVFDQSVYDEWMVSYVLPSLKASQKWHDIFRNASLMDEWPSRPLKLEPLPAVVEMTTVKYIDKGILDMAENTKRLLAGVIQPVPVVAPRKLFQ